MPGGVGLFDYDGDGYLDIYFVQAGDLDPSIAGRPGNRMYRNLGDGTFTDVAEIAGVADADWGASAAFTDYDCDGYLDLLHCQLY